MAMVFDVTPWWGKAGNADITAPGGPHEEFPNGLAIDVGRVAR
jgi:hypothetical protein